MKKLISLVLAMMMLLSVSLACAKTLEPDNTEFERLSGEQVNVECFVKRTGCNGFCESFHYRPNASRYIFVNSSASSNSSGSNLRNLIIWRIYFGS